MQSPPRVGEEDVLLSIIWFPRLRVNWDEERSYKKKFTMFTICCRMLMAVGNGATSAKKTQKKPRYKKCRTRHNFLENPSSILAVTAGWSSPPQYPTCASPQCWKTSAQGMWPSEEHFAPDHSPPSQELLHLFVSASVSGCCFQQCALYIWHSGQRSRCAAVASRRYCIMRGRSQAKFYSFIATASIAASFYVFTSPGGFWAHHLIFLCCLVLFYNMISVFFFLS